MSHCAFIVTRIYSKVARRLGTLVPLASLLCLAACVPLVETQDGRHLRATSPAFKDYVERVFRQQNNLSWALVEALETVSDPDKRQKLNQLESQLRRACEPVNRLASARRRGTASSRAEQLALVRTLPQCEASSQEARQLLNRLNEGRLP